MSTTEQNKATILRFNREVIEQGSEAALNELVATNVVNHATPAGAPNGPESFSFFLFNILRKGISDIKVDILDQIAEGDKVTTRKTIHGTHTGNFMGIPATGKKLAIQVIDIIRLSDGQYAEHWGMSNMADVVAELRKK